METPDYSTVSGVAGVALITISTAALALRRWLSKDNAARAGDGAVVSAIEMLRALLDDERKHSAQLAESLDGARKTIADVTDRLDEAMKHSTSLVKSLDDAHEQIGSLRDQVSTLTDEVKRLRKKISGEHDDKA